MSDFFTTQDLERLLAHEGKPAVSIFLPTTRIPTRVQAESLQFKNLVRDAEEHLAEFDLRGPEVLAMLEPARELISDTEFWRHQLDGLAVFLSEELFLTYQVPITFEAGLFVGEAFHLKPLLPLLSHDPEFYILAVSQNHVRFLKCTRFSVHELEPQNVPSSLQEVLSEYEFDNQLQFHTSASAPGTGRRAAIFHGVGAGATEDEKSKIREFFDRIDKGLKEFLHNQRAPLVFAGVDYLFPIYQDANTYANLVERSVEGNPDELSGRELHTQAWKFVEQRMAETRTAAIEQFYNLSGQADMTSVVLEEVVPWADQGRIDTLFVDKQALVWGVYDGNQFAVEAQDKRTRHNRDLTDMAAIFTLLREGKLYLLTPEEMEMEFGPDNRHTSAGNNGAGKNGAGKNGASNSGSSNKDGTKREEDGPAVAAIYRFSVEATTPT